MYIYIYIYVYITGGGSNCLAKGEHPEENNSGVNK